MSEKIRLGSVTCDFMGLGEFLEQGAQWLTTARPHHVVTLNPEMIMLAEKNAAFRAAVAAADLRVPDGAGLVWARWYLRSSFWPLVPSLMAFLFQNVERVTGVDAVLSLGKLAQERGQALYLLGGTPNQRERTGERLQNLWPGLTVYLAPEHDFSLTGPESILADIRAKEPAVLLVAYGAPKQTEWIERSRALLPSVKLAMGVGGAFAILSEDLSRAPGFLRRLNLEWLWRFYLEPARAPRIWQATVKFPALIRKQKRRG